MDPTSASSGKNANRVAAGRINGCKRRRWTDEEKKRIRERCLLTKPWLHATGPRTLEGKLIASANGRYRQAVGESVRSIRAGVADVQQLLQSMRSLRATLGGM